MSTSRYESASFSSETILLRALCHTGELAPLKADTTARTSHSFGEIFTATTVLASFKRQCVRLLHEGACTTVTDPFLQNGAATAVHLTVSL